jgi:MFS transporter, DHA1 family, inner membrane transport protein
MAFFRNRAVNRLNLHYALHAFAENAGGIFILVFLLRAGVSVPATLMTLAGLLAGRFLLRPLVLPIAKRWGLRPVLIAGTLIIAATYPMLAAIHGAGPALAAYCTLASLGGVFYWTSYHAYFAAAGDAEHRGHQTGAREALAAVPGILAPLAGGWSLAVAGPAWAFAGAGAVQALAALPLIGAPNIAVARAAPQAFQAARPGLLLFLADGSFAGGFYYIWQIALFISLGESFPAYGGAMALAALAGAVCALFQGRRIDKGYGRQAVLIAYGAAAVTVIMRAGSFGLPWPAITANAAGAIVAALLIPALMTPFYNLAKTSPCPLRFNIATEGAWDIGCGTTCVLAAGLAAAGFPLGNAVLLALPGAAAAAVLLSSHYNRAGL